ncbi:hypothetical protein J2787_000616 [Chryseobacterium rhizosphaerae]|uniref:Uncharacterized protein n=1 Tax=Chryseobacterium rhizosphaerae TaxID=395937 RepID=A0AAE3Y7T6_9FLAO|nr:hypothetical protein [Chryseobacterium rhizosphaerae]MDR6525246.1 hypothetical protein [Chryseobacterium rhizosphaerae]
MMEWKTVTAQKPEYFNLQLLFALYLNLTDTCRKNQLEHDKNTVRTASTGAMRV